MRWVFGLILLMSFGHVLAQESDIELQRPEPTTYDQAIVRFNTHIQALPSWQAFQAEIFPRVRLGTVGHCYLVNGKTLTVHVTPKTLPREETGEWQKTSGKGWRLQRADRTFLEYRVNKRAGMLLLAEGTKSRFFFSQTRRLCEFPLAAR